MPKEIKRISRRNNDNTSPYPSGRLAESIREGDNRRERDRSSSSRPLDFIKHNKQIQDKLAHTYKKILTPTYIDYIKSSRLIGQYSAKRERLETYQAPSNELSTLQDFTKQKLEQEIRRHEDNLNKTEHKQLEEQINEYNKMINDYSRTHSLSKNLEKFPPFDTQQQIKDTSKKTEKERLDLLDERNNIVQEYEDFIKSREADQHFDLADQCFQEAKQLFNQTREHLNQATEKLTQVPFDIQAANHMYHMTQQLLCQAEMQLIRAERHFDNTRLQDGNTNYNLGHTNFEHTIRLRATGRGFWGNSTLSSEQASIAYREGSKKFDSAQEAYRRGSEAYNDGLNADQNSQRKLTAHANKSEVEQFMEASQIQKDRIHNTINREHQRIQNFEPEFNSVEMLWNNINALDQRIAQKKHTSSSSS